MHKTRIYLDTSVINFLYADDAPEKKAITEEFFEKYVRLGVYDVFVSVVVVDEINLTNDDEHRRRLLNVVDEYRIPVIELSPVTAEVVPLATRYILEGVVPAKNRNDALHVALTTIMDYNVLLSWNFRHLANINREARFLAINMNLGYIKPFRITIPYEVCT